MDYLFHNYSYLEGESTYEIKLSEYERVQDLGIPTHVRIYKGKAMLHTPKTKKNNSIKITEIEKRPTRVRKAPVRYQS